MDQCEETLDNIWRDDQIQPAYPQARMEHFFRVLTMSFCSRIEKEFSKNDIWQASTSDVRVKLNECMRICSNWSESALRLTRSWLKDSDEMSAFFKGKDKGAQRSKHIWETKDKKRPYSDSHLENMISRI